MVLVSVLYVWTYFVTAYLVAPLQSALMPSVVMSILFLPHGIRVLAAWLYGWRSVAYLLPGAALCNLHFSPDRAFAPAVLTGTVASLVAAPLALVILRLAFPSIRLSPGTTGLAAMVVLGALASLLNLTALKLALSLDTAEGAVIFLGDTAGLILSLALLRATLHMVGNRI